MSRVRMAYVVAFFGILITTGGCAESVTAPQAASVGGAGISAKRDAAPADSTVTASSSDNDVSTMGGVILVGGGRVSEP